MYDYLIAGCGFAGAVLAERLANAGKSILIVDKREHIAGNTYDYYNNEGILVHKYGPHIFHTNSEEIFTYLSKFTSWRAYEHRVLASVEGQLLPIPINLTTINRLYSKRLTSEDLDSFLDGMAEKRKPILTSEDVVVNAVGKDLYEKFFRGYTKKQWGLDPSELDASVTARVPTRTTADDRYFTDEFQAMPKHGYTELFKKMLSHANIHIMLQADYRDLIETVPHRRLIYTGPIDAYFDYCYGKLPYRSIDFRFETMDLACYQETGTINYPTSNLYTRITEFKYLTGQSHKKTTVVFEYPKSEGDPYYPIPRKENQDLYNRYKELAEMQKDVFFTGRLGTYKYYNMDQIVAQSLTLFKKIAKEDDLEE